MTSDDRDRDMPDETSPGEGDVRDDLDMRRPTDLDDEVEAADERGQKIEGGDAAGAGGGAVDAGAGAGDKIEDEAEDDDVSRRDDQATNR